MKTTYFTFLFLIIGLAGYGQKNFKKGYFIKNNGEKVNCLILNEEWSNYSKTFSYKLSSNSEVLTGKVEEVAQFSITRKSKYIRSSFAIDNAKDNTEDLKGKRDPDYSNKTAFIKVIVEGDQVNLYEYSNANQTRYFFKKGNNEITLLKYNKYKDANGNVAENEIYKKQLSEVLWAKCRNLSLNIKYKKSDLGDYVVAYNNCNQISKSLMDYRVYENRGTWNLKVKGGINISKVDSDNRSGYSGEVSKTNVRFGLEIEHILSSKNKNWSIFFEPTFSSFKDDLIDIDYNSLEFPIGLRNYIDIFEASRFFTNVGLSLDFSGSSEIDLNKIDSSTSGFFGFGVLFNDKISIESRFYSKRKLIQDNNLISADQANIAVILGYKF